MAEDPASGGIPVAAPSKPRRARVGRAAVAAAILWLVAGASCSLIASTAVHRTALLPQLFAYGAVLIGWPIVVLAGRRFDVRTRREWAQTWALTFGVLVLLVGTASCVAAIAMYG
ncbi:MAG: hypothetical protein ABIV26_02110 [Candidatus Limnocylindrales bacterium]